MARSGRQETASEERHSSIAGVESEKETARNGYDTYTNGVELLVGQTANSSGKSDNAVVDCVCSEIR